MTFKHVKFEDSPTMRALEKVAKEKGLVKPETLQKQAAVSKTADYTPSNDLLENILKLCSGLRAQGLKEVAAELETKFLNYKQAQTLYETSTEKGEDLINAAHPKGSHKLENVDGDEAVVENVLDIHDKLLEMVNKKPTGKLSNAKQIIKEVKRVLAQQQSAQSLLQAASDLVNQAITIAGKGGGLSDSTFNWASARAKLISGIAAKGEHDLTINDATDAEDATNAIARNLHPNLLHNYLPEFLNKGISSDDVWDKIEKLLNDAVQKIKSAATVIKSSALTGNDETGTGALTYQLKEVTPEQTPLSSLYTRIGTIRQKLQSYKLIGSISRNANAVEWINTEIKELDNLVNRMKQIPESMEVEMSKRIEPEIIDLEADVADFTSQWIQSK